MRFLSFGRDFLSPAGGVASPRRVRVAMRAASARWPDGRWVRGRRTLGLMMPDGSCGLLVSW